MKNDIPSVLSQEKKDHILADHPSLVQRLKAHRKEHTTHASGRDIDLKTPAWVRVSPGPAMGDGDNGYRLCIGFRNIGCKYRERDRMGLGCLNCGYYVGTAFQDVDTHTIKEQFVAGLRQAGRDNVRFNAVEFLSDGSFLNPDELGRDTQVSLFDLLSRMPRVRRILVESRPEYVEKCGLVFLLGLLRQDQRLEVGIGFESSDEFIREVCINKGFSNAEFESAIAVIASLDEPYRKRVSVVAYLLVKPAFLTQRESIEDIVASLKYLKSLEDKYRVRIAPKLEPAAIVNGTLLSLLHQDRDFPFHYEPLSYWAVLEILAKAARDSEIRSMNIRIGAREDMDEMMTPPAIYQADGQIFHPFDFVVYESIQKFNQHQNFYRLFAVVSEIQRQMNGVSLTGDGAASMQWLEDNGIQDSAIAAFLAENAGAIEEEITNPSTRYEIQAMTSIYAVLDIMEGYNTGARALKVAIDEALSKGDKTSLELRIGECFDKAASEDIVKVSVEEISTIGGYAEVFFDVLDLLRDEKFSIWSRFLIA
uniref:Radical SAM enzyme, TIGR01210 family n=1 Tax=Candidatus Kentrum sp. SD TaxID=2126332 RepID=A0A450YHD7_9GAMM|nr:MAG: radical SAM enzyme, TIGR01210 family [Candidatus Kentron sp. SD]VFK47344.1 MAG: radical SAM enzyme, TIGR01210 family [Candidatus Kentron sp. SD]VFK80057.1 MAG: radical SAM enzyme, TIGR01210 family [Candidatus Kentron sp. SD]